MKLGRWGLRLDRPEVAEEPAVYRDRLAELARILHGLPWLLAGGLAIPLTLGRFYRSHFDVDIAFPRHAFPAIEAAMRHAGFYLSTYFPFRLIGSLRAAVHLRVSADGWLPRRRPRKLKFRDGSGTRPPPHLLAVVEALPFEITGGRLQTCDGRHRLPLDRPLEGHRHRTDDGHDIPCLDLHYVAQLKRGKGAPKDDLDRAVIREWRRSALKASVP